MSSIRHSFVLNSNQIFQIKINLNPFNEEFAFDLDSFSAPHLVAIFRGGAEKNRKRERVENLSSIKTTTAATNDRLCTMNKIQCGSET